jgi:hypothetical protein
VNSARLNNLPALVASSNAALFAALSTLTPRVGRPVVRRSLLSPALFSELSPEWAEFDRKLQ